MIIWIISSQGNTLAWIDYRNFPGGPIGFFESTYLVNIDIVGGVMLVLGNVLADALLVSKDFMALVQHSQGSLVALPMSCHLGCLEWILQHDKSESCYGISHISVSGHDGYAIEYQIGTRSSLLTLK